MKAWAAIGATMHIWDYTTNFSHYSLPMPNMQVVTPDIRWYIEHNARGIMLQGSYQSPGSDNGILRSWVWGKQLWDPSLDTRALMRDFIYGYYGKAAEPIAEYNDLLWRHLDRLPQQAAYQRRREPVDGSYPLPAGHRVPVEGLPQPSRSGSSPGPRSSPMTPRSLAG